MSNNNPFSPNIAKPHDKLFTLENIKFEQINNSLIIQFSLAETGDHGIRNFEILDLHTNGASLHCSRHYWSDEQVEIDYDPDDKRIELSCACKTMKSRMCEHQRACLEYILDNPQINAFFNEAAREELLRAEAEKFGLEEVENIEDHFYLEYENNLVKCTPFKEGILPIESGAQILAHKSLLPPTPRLKPIVRGQKLQRGIVFSTTRYTGELGVFFFEAPTSAAGKVKSPFTELRAMQQMENEENIEALRFYAALELMRADAYHDSSTEDKFKAIKRIAKNPLNLPVFVHDASISDNIHAKSVKEVRLSVDDHFHISLDVSQKDNFYEIDPFIEFGILKKLELKTVKLKFNHFFLFQNTFYLTTNSYLPQLFNFFKDHQFKLILHKSKFEDFKRDYLDQMESQVQINYEFVLPATGKQIKASGLNKTLQKSIYIEESDGYILLTPSVRYGEIEIPILSLRNVHDFDEEGQMFSYHRDKSLENAFVGVLLRQHHHFEEQLGQFEYFYLSRQAFLDSGWFIDAFDEWKSMDIEVLGFSDISDNLINPNKMSVSVSVASGIDWFDTSVRVKFGPQEVNLRAIQKAIKNKSRFVKLDDGTKGLMPEEWIKKFGQYFRSSELVGATLRTAKINYSIVEQLYEDADLDEAVQIEINALRKKIEGFKSIESVEVPNSLKAELRDYQKDGLNWLNYLDEFNFGGCLADDMGLGKTIQVLAFLLLQKQKYPKSTSLVVLPTTLIFNWQNEIKKFAPILKVFVNHAQHRLTNKTNLEKVDIVMTTYGTMISDIEKLKKIDFNYVILDESQAIKNPASQRYKSARLLSARNRLVLTGTPIENNTFDLYAQLSFAHPGLFINQARFKEHYALPIDKFKDLGRAQELQQRIDPFLLRRTKKQVAKELPEKTEMIFQCPMSPDQQKVYDSFRENIQAQLKDPEQRRIPGQFRMLMLTGLMKLRQICNSPALLNEEADYGSESAKIDVLLREIEARHKNHKILVFSQFVGMLDLIKKELQKREINHEYLTGQTKDREQRIHRFQNEEEVRVFLISLKAGGTGLNLTEADYVFLVDPWWNPAAENQAIDRCYRIGQKKNVVAIRLVTPNTIESKIQEMQANKLELADELIRTDAHIEKDLKQEDLLRLFES